MILQILAATAEPVQKATAAAQATLNPALLKQIQDAAAAQANPSRSPLALHYPWLTHAFAAIFITSAVLLIFLLAIQTTKQEGLSGSIGGRVESAYRGRLGGDQQIARLTMYVAVTFIIFGTLLSLSGI